MSDIHPSEVPAPPGEEAVNAAPPVADSRIPIVALGGSAGSIEALRRFFEHLPADSGLVFVVILHLSPHHESILADLLQKTTTMPVIQVQKTTEIKRNTVYVIPPRKSLHSIDGHLKLSDLARGPGRHMAVDLFFRSLADTHGADATAVVLSGADGDGAIGIKRIKERGGLTIAQDPEEAQHRGMPGSAIVTGMVDWVLRVDEMPDRIIQYYRFDDEVKLPPEQPEERPAQEQRDLSGETALKDVLNYLRTRTGRDFNSYKRATILRRIRRRMQVNRIDTLASYLGYLRTHPGECGALQQDLLISVTNFFRDADSFAALEERLAQFLHRTDQNQPIRVWVTACATGEEAYSFAILLSDYARTLDVPPVIQIFATDLDEDAIRIARAGIYPLTIAVDMSEDRLRRYFIREHDGYRVRREIREMVLFAVHDVLKDSPFSRVDLISCRNLLIYLNREAQNRLLDTFHFALKADGHLMLGTSESMDEASPTFAVVDKKHRLFVRRSTPRLTVPLPIPAPHLKLALTGPEPATELPVPRLRLLDDDPGPAISQTAGEARRHISWNDLHFQLLEQLAPPSILVDSEHEIVHLSEGAGRFLQVPGGQPSRNLIRTIHPGLRIELRAALLQAAQAEEAVAVGPIQVALAGEPVAVRIRIKPVDGVARGLVLVMLDCDESATAREAPVPVPPHSDSDPVVARLDQEVERLKAHLRETVEQFEASTEELKASNEELQAMNEELRSATEELETSREELQSTNEELITVNQELKSKVEELGDSNSDLHNLMDATAIGTIFLDRELRITRFTPSAVTLFKLISADINRPLSDLTTSLEYPLLSEDARQVLNKLVPVEREVGSPNGEWYLARIRPYRTLDDHIAGVVLTFVDITERKRATEALRQSEERFSAIVTQATVGVVRMSMNGIATFSNRYLRELLGYSEADLDQTPLLSLIHTDDRPEIERRFRQLTRQRKGSFSVEARGLKNDGSTLWLHNSINLLTDANGQPSSALLICTDVSERKRAEEAQRQSEERLRMIIENAVEYAIFSTDLHRRVTSWNTGAQKLLGYSGEDILGAMVDSIYTDDDRRTGVPEREVHAAVTLGRSSDDRLHRRKDGRQFWCTGAMMPMHDEAGDVIGFVKILRDQSEERATRETLENSQAELTRALAENVAARKAVEAGSASKDRFLAVLSHELRNPLASIISASQAFNLTADGADRARAAQIVQRQSYAMKILLDDLLDMSRLRLGRMSLQRREATLSEIVDLALEAIRELVEDGSHHVRINLPFEPLLLNVDPIRMSQVLSNLLTNAVKYTPEGGRIELSAQVVEDELLLTVEDNGIGMHPETVESMFDMFSQSNPAEHSLKGLGIGLALVRSIVELHGGTVSGTSSGTGQGSTFTVHLPAHAVLVRTGAAAVAGGPGVQSPAPGKDFAAASEADLRIVLADDNIDVAWPLKLLLEQSGFEVHVAEGGVQAVQLAEELRPDVAVLDIGMPDLDGYAVATRLRGEDWGRSIFLIAATGWGQQSDRDDARKAGFDAHLVKPVDLAELHGLLSQAAQRRRKTGVP